MVCVNDSTAWGMIQFSDSLNFKMASAVTLLFTGNLMKNLSPRLNTSQNLWVISAVVDFPTAKVLLCPKWSFIG